LAQRFRAVVAGETGAVDAVLGGMSHLKFRVALADDDASVRRIVRLALEEMHAGVVEAADGAVLRTLLLEQRFDIVVTDLRMPRWSGLAVLLEARARGDSTPGILMTGDAVAVRDAVPRGSGIQLLEKPFVSAALKRAVSACLRVPIGVHSAAMPAANV
jgi:DNA-binding NtrC family response regulator